MPRLQVTWPNIPGVCAVAPAGEAAGRITRTGSGFVIVYDSPECLALASHFILLEKRRANPGDLELLEEELENVKAIKALW